MSRASGLKNDNRDPVTPVVAVDQEADIGLEVVDTVHDTPGDAIARQHRSEHNLDACHSSEQARPEYERIRRISSHTCGHVICEQAWLVLEYLRYVARQRLAQGHALLSISEVANRQDIAERRLH
jgi:hypothetical protein